MNKTVSIERAADYSIKTIEQSLDTALGKIGGLKKHIKKGDTVALKPNLVMSKKPEHAATTHPAIIECISRMINDIGAKPVIVESPGGPYTKTALRTIYSVTGITKAAEKGGAGLNYDTGRVEIENQYGKILKKLTVIKPLLDADVIINLPKLKTHGQMVYSGAVKNMFGAVPGIMKAEYHFRFPDYDTFADSIIDIFLSVKPHLNIMDAVVCMEGEGPTAGRPKNLGLIIASDDAFCLDIAALNLIKCDILKVPVLKNAVKRNLCPDSIDQIKVLSDDFTLLKCSNFDIPPTELLRTISFISKGPFKFLTEILRPRPYIKGDKCIGCGICRDRCPAEAIELIGKKPGINMKKCIRCFCCQELCPKEAVKIRRRFLSR